MNRSTGAVIAVNDWVNRLSVQSDGQRPVTQKAIPAHNHSLIADHCLSTNFQIVQIRERQADKLRSFNEADGRGGKCQHARILTSRTA